MNIAKRRLLEKALPCVLLGAIFVLNGCSGGGPASIRYKFSSPAFSSEELETLQSTVHTRIETWYQKSDGKSAGCDWILLKKGEIDEAKHRIYFSETKEAESYVIGISGKDSFREFAGILEAEAKKLYPGKKFEKHSTSKMEKSIQFLESEL